MMKDTKKITVEAQGKGHFEVEYEDGLVGSAFYCSLEMVIISLSKQTPHRIPKSISWVED